MHTIKGRFANVSMLVPEDEEDQMKFMRTKSTETLQGQSSQDKWKSLFKMFKEWKHQTTVANAQYVYVTTFGTFSISPD